jgi:hypothetical protein
MVNAVELVKTFKVYQKNCEDHLPFTHFFYGVKIFFIDFLI